VKKVSTTTISVGYLTYDINFDSLFTTNAPFTPLDVALTNSGIFDPVRSEVTVYVFPGVDWGYNQIKRIRNYSQKVGIVLLMMNDTNANIEMFETGFCVYFNNKFYKGFVLKKAVFDSNENIVYPSSIILERAGGSNKIQIVASTTGMIDGSGLMNLNTEMIGELTSQ